MKYGPRRKEEMKGVRIYKGRNPAEDRFNAMMNSLSEDTRKKLKFCYDECTPIRIKYFKKADITPKKGDIFRVCLDDGSEFNGVVLNAGTKAYYSEIYQFKNDVIAILKPNVNIFEACARGIHKEDLIFSVKLIYPQMWTNGCFQIYDHVDEVKIDSYGFLEEDIFVDETCKPIKYIPEIWDLYETFTSLIGCFSFYLITGLDYSTEVDLLKGSSICE